MKKRDSIYKWERVGNQDEYIRRVCYLDPYLLEHAEAYWKKKVLYMVSRVYLWDDENKIPELIEELPNVKYSKNSHKCLEDWYAMNVLFDKLFTSE